jgi:lactate dehydrogenase-like 2-hydroxyacid dehydrogenase
MIFIAITSNGGTKNFIDAKKISKMKDGVILINPAAPDLIDEKALVDALESGKVSAVAIDGHYESDALKKFGGDKVIATPQITARTKEAWDITDMMAFKNIVDFFENEKAG